MSALSPDLLSRAALDTEIEGRPLALSNLDKVLWPAAGFTKGQMLDYYVRIAPLLLPHLADRPVTLGRFPDGVEGPGFAQTECRGRPEWMGTAQVRLRTGVVRSYCLVNDLPSLLWVANLGTIELHPFLARAGAMDQPDAVVFDLDPSPPADILDCCRVALWLREALAEAALAASLKTSGAAGLHAYAPLGPGHEYSESKAFARTVAEALAQRHPEQVVTRAVRSLRPGKVLVDWLQNDRMRSTVAPYSLRATSWPTVSTPVSWEEASQALKTGQPERLVFDAAELPGRVEGSRRSVPPCAGDRSDAPS